MLLFVSIWICGFSSLSFVNQQKLHNDNLDKYKKNVCRQ